MLGSVRAQSLLPACALTAVAAAAWFLATHEGPVGARSAAPAPDAPRAVAAPEGVDLQLTAPPPARAADPRPTGVEPERTPAASTPSRVAIEAPAPASMENTRVCGRLARSDGRPVVAEDAQIEFNSGTWMALRAEIDASGAWSIASLPAGTWSVTARLAGCFDADARVAIAVDGPEQRIDFVLDPIDLVRVHLLATDLPGIRSRLSTDLPFRGWRGLRISATSEDVRGVLRPEEVREGGAPDLARFVRRRDGSGADDATLALLVDAEAQFAPRGFGEWPGACVGWFAFRERPGVHVHLSLGPAVLRSEFVPPGERDVTFRVASWDLDALVASARLRLVDADGDHPIAGVSVELTDPGSDSMLATSDAQGIVRFERVLPGWHGLSLQLPGRATREERVFVARGGETDFGTWRLDLTTTIRGQVLDRAGRPRRVSLLARPLEAIDEQRFVRAGRGRSSAETGEFAIAGLGRGAYLVLVEDDSLAARPLRVDTSGGDLLDVRVDVESATAVTLKIADALPEGALVRLETPEGLPVFAALPRVVRSYELRLAPGEYRMSVTHEGRALSTRRVEIQDEPIVLSFDAAPGSSPR